MEFGYWILEGHKLVKVNDIVTWGQFFEDISKRRVALTERGRIRVSTVFIGIDHNFGLGGKPILFETMVFGGHKWDGYQDRYHTWDEAEAGHRRIAKQVFGGWSGAIEVLYSELIYIWNLIPVLRADETWKDMIRWLFFLRRRNNDIL